MRKKSSSKIGAVACGLFAALCIFNLVSTLCASPGPTWSRQLSDNEEGENESGHDSHEQIMKATMILVITIFLILMTIAFEETKEHIEEKTDDVTRPIVEALFGEMTILGFLSAFTFALVHLGFFKSASVYLFGEDEKELLEELFEMVHYDLFFIMVAFVLQVFLILGEARKTEKEWLEMDRICATQEEIEPSSTNQALINFRALREEFIKERSVEPPFDEADMSNRVPDDFNFGRYLSLSHGKMLAAAVHVNVITWAFFILFSTMMYAIVIALKGNVVTLGWIWSGLMWFVVGFTFYYGNYIIEIQKALLEPCISQETNFHGKKEHLVTSSHTHQNLPTWCSIDLDAYLAKRSWIVRKISPSIPNRHDTLFWFEKKGPKVHLLILQSRLIFCSVYVTFLIQPFYPQLYAQCSIGSFIAYIFFSLCPLVILMTFKRRLIANVAVVGYTGSLRRHEIVSSVIREEKTKEIVHTFLILDKMNRFVQSSGLGNDPARNDTKVRRHCSSDVAEMKSISMTFDTFDLDKSGSLSRNEMECLVKVLGCQQSANIVKLIASIDTDNNGIISKDEFLSWYENNILTVLDGISSKERAHHLFQMFDKNSSGSISMGEFKSTLDSLNVRLSVDEVGEIVRELDSDGNFMISVEEFEFLIEKYSDDVEYQEDRGELA